MKLKFSIAFGSIIILIAIVLILSAVGVVPAYLTSVIISWQGLIVLGGIKLIMLRQHLVGAALTLTGAYFMTPHIYKQLGTTMPIEQSMLTTLFVASLLIVGGLATMAIGRRWMCSDNKRYFEVKPNKDGLQQISCAFSQINHAIIEKPLRGAVVSTAFGELTLNLSKTTLDTGDTFLEVNNAFGATKILVPASWIVNPVMQSFLGEVKDMRTNTPIESDRRLILRGAVAFGMVEIVSTPEETTLQQVTSDECIETISVKHNNRVHIITLDELLYIQADGDYVTLSTTQGSFLKEQTMKYFQGACLQTNLFVSIDRIS